MAQGHICLQKCQKESVITNYIAFIIIFLSVFKYFLKRNSSPFIIIACKRVTLLKIYHGRIKKNDSGLAQYVGEKMMTDS